MSTPLRRFKHIKGFTNATLYLESRDEGMLFLINKYGDEYRTNTYTLRYALEKVAEGSWIEMPVKR